MSPQQQQKLAVPSNTAQAYINHGRYVADCPVDTCTSAEELTLGQTSMVCTECHVMSPIVWPNKPEKLMEALLKRPDKTTRNWLPGGHQLAQLGGYPTDQSPAELEEETTKNLDKDAGRRAKKREAMTILAELGVTVDADGNINGRL